MVWCCTGVVALGAVGALLIAVPVGVWLLAGGLVVLAVVRLVGHGDAWRIARSRGFDVALLLVLATALTYLGFTPAL